MSNGQNSFVSEALADGLLQQLVCLLIHTGCGLIDAQHLPGIESERELPSTTAETPLPAWRQPEESAQDICSHYSSDSAALSAVPSQPWAAHPHPCSYGGSALTLACVRRALARHTSCLCPTDRLFPLSPSSLSSPPARGQDQQSPTSSAQGPKQLHQSKVFPEAHKIPILLRPRP